MSDLGLAGPLQHEHREIDAQLAEFEAALRVGEWRPAPLAEAASALRHHIYLEEAFVFPPLRAAGLFGPIAVMYREHGEIWQALDEVEGHAATAVDPTAALEAFRNLAVLLESHNAKEELIVYPEADSGIAGSALEEIHEVMAANALPDGWICQALR